jgi:hypothetical protein
MRPAAVPHVSSVRTPLGQQPHKAGQETDDHPFGYFFWPT